jgi:nitrogen-specific signal transduction histidine kinase
MEQLIQAVLNIVHNAAQALHERVARGDAQIILRTRWPGRSRSPSGFSSWHWICM